MRTEDRENIEAKVKASPPPYAILYRVCSLVVTEGTGNDPLLVGGTPPYVCAIWSQALEGSCSNDTSKSHIHGKSDNRREGSAGPILAHLGTLST
jgi:hypothetical protein